MSHKWNVRFVQLAAHVAEWSKDPSTKVGAVIVNSKNQILSLGFNGFPRGVDDRPERYADREQKYPRVVHGEMNAILNTGVPMALEGSSLYVTLLPCCECAKAIIQVGIAEVFVPASEQDERWSDSQDIAVGMMREAGVSVSVVSII